MSELTDLEVCKRIAEIEGFTDLIEEDGRLFWQNWCVAEGTQYNLFDPIKDNEQCFELMIKYKVILYPEYDGTYVCKIGNKINSKHKNPNAVICLSIIAHSSGDV